MGKITATDRLIFTLLFSIIINLTIVLGVSFDATSPPTNQPRLNLEITLVKQQTIEAPEQADFLAQASNEGGGETEEKSPEPTPDITEPAEQDLPPEPVVEPVQPEAVIETPEPVVETVMPKPEPPKPKPVKPEPLPAQAEKILTAKQADRKEVTTPEIADQKQEPAEMPEKPPLSARELMMNAQTQIAQLEQQFNMSRMELSKRPKKRRISAATKEYAAAAYIKAWASKVERIGNFNYPQEAKQKGINGSLMLSVDINPDGSVPANGIVISRSSGHKVLDDAAVKIVRLGAPYAAIPDNVLLGNDMLTIIRTWKFETNQGLSAR
ncbi:MAG: TonB family protein [Gammaproteobacteria bacterium]|nr:TonB family protein [Gammaproteobacteria bacterium]